MLTMELRFTVETLFENGDTKKCRVDHIRRLSETASPENLGLSLGEAKALLNRLQAALLQDRIVEMVKNRRTFGYCRKSGYLHHDRGLLWYIFFGRFTINYSRRYQCFCCMWDDATNTGLRPALVKLMPNRALPELVCLQTDLGSRPSFQEAARLIETYLPCAPLSNKTARYCLEYVAKQMASIGIWSVIAQGAVVGQGSYKYTTG